MRQIILLLRFFLLSAFICWNYCSSLGLPANHRYCQPIPDQSLRRQLGESFDARYMSNTDPRKSKSAQSGPHLASLDSGDEFRAVDRQMRHRKRNHPPWFCNTVPEVTDLGPDHFPRYMHSRKCSTDRCWHGKSYCAPGSLYYVHFLRRIPGKCMEVTQENMHLMPYDVLDKDEPIFVESWVLVKYPVVTGCVCMPFPDRFHTP